MKIEEYFNSIGNKVKENKNFEKQCAKLLAEVRTNPKSSKITNILNKLEIDRKLYEKKTINEKLINEIKANYYEKHNRKFLNNLFQGFKDIKQAFSSLSVDNLDRNLDMKKYNEKLEKINFFKKVLSISLKHIFMLDESTKSFNEIENFQNYIKSKSSVVYSRNENQEVLVKIVNYDTDKDNSFIDTYFLTELSDIESENDSILKKKDEYLKYCEEQIKSLPKNTWLSKNNSLLKNILFLKELEPYFKKTSTKNSIYSFNFPDNPIKQCNRLIKKLENDYKYKLKMDKLCKKYGINQEFIKNVGNKLLSNHHNYILNDLQIKLYRSQLKKNNSKISSNKWSISWRKFFLEKIGIFKNTFKKQIESYTKINEELNKERESILKNIQVKVEELLPNCVKASIPGSPKREVITVVSNEQTKKNRKNQDQLQILTNKAEELPNVKDKHAHSHTLG